MNTKERKRTYIIVLCLATVALLSIFVYWLVALRANRTNVYQNLSSSNKEILAKFNVVSNGKFDTIETFAAALAKYPLSELSEEELLVRMQDIQEADERTQFVGVGDVDGNVLINTGVTYSAAGRDYFERAKNGEQSVAFIKNNLVSDTAVILCATPIIVENEFKGFVTSVFTADSARQHLYCHEYGDDSTGLLVKSDGTLLLHEKQNADEIDGKIFGIFENAKIKDSYTAADIKEDFKNLKEGTIRYKQDGEIYYASYTYSGTNDWMLMTVVPQADAEAEVRTSIIGVWIISASIFVIAAAVIGILARYERKLIKSAENDKMQLAMSQIKPHFIYNTLTTIQALCYIEPEQAADTVVLFSKYLRSVFNVTRTVDVAPFSSEVEKATDYLKLERLRFGEKLKYELDIQISDFLVPVLSLQPLVSNAIKHGVAKRAEFGTIKITSQLDGNDVIIKVSDDGVGYDTSSVEEKSLVGIRKRFSSLVDGKLTIESVVGKGTTVTIKLPYKRQKNESSVN